MRAKQESKVARVQVRECLAALSELGASPAGIAIEQWHLRPTKEAMCARMISTEDSLALKTVQERRLAAKLRNVRRRLELELFP